MRTTFLNVVIVKKTFEKDGALFMKQTSRVRLNEGITNEANSVYPILFILGVVVFLSGLKDFVNAALTRNALTIITECLQVNDNFNRAFQAVVLLALSLCFFPVIDKLADLLKVRLRQYYRRKTATQVLNKYEHMKFQYFDSADTYDLCTRTTKVAEDKMVNWHLNLLDLMKNLVSAVSLAILVIDIAWWTLPFCLVTVIPMILLNLRKAKDMHEAEEARAYYDRKADYASGLILHKESLMELKLFRSMQYIRKIWSENLENSASKKREISFHAGKQGAVVNMIYAWAGIPVVLVVLWQVTHGKITFADYMVLSNAISTLGLVVVYGIAGKSGAIKEGLLFFKDYRKIMNYEEQQESSSTCNQSFEMLQFEDVSFTYPGTQKKILDGVTFTIRQGEKVAITGVNGAGKSTLIKLVLGLYKPDTGRVTINGVDVELIPAKRRANLVSAVFQDYTKYDMTIRENIAFGNLKKLNTDLEIKKAAKLGMIDEKIGQLHDGLDTRLGTIYGDGSNLSEGQWQKLNLARLFLSEAGLLVLDEPTAAMDAKAESELYETFLNLSKKKSCILISHRLGSTKICDRILVLSNGKILEQGSHKELMRNDGMYARMYEAQSSWYHETVSA